MNTKYPVKKQNTHFSLEIKGNLKFKLSKNKNLHPFPSPRKKKSPYLRKLSNESNQRKRPSSKEYLKKRTSLDKPFSSTSFTQNNKNKQFHQSYKQNFSSYKRNHRENQTPLRPSSPNLIHYHSYKRPISIHLREPQCSIPNHLKKRMLQSDKRRKSQIVIRKTYFEFKPKFVNYFEEREIYLKELEENSEFRRKFLSND